MMRRLISFIGALLGATVLTACGSNSATAPTSVAPNTATWTTSVYPGGSASRTFTASQGGTVTVTLVTTGVPVGFGVGVPLPSGGGCLLSTSRVDGQGATLSVDVEKGDYCVTIYDAGTLAAPLGFTAQIDFP